MSNNISKAKIENAKLLAFSSDFDDNSQALKALLSSENALLVMVLSAYTAYQYPPAKKDKTQGKSDTKTVVVSTIQARMAQLSEFSFVDPSSQLITNLDNQIDQIVIQFSSKNDTPTITSELSKLFSDCASSYGVFNAVQQSWLRLQKTYSTKEKFAQQVVPFLYNKLFPQAIKKQWSDSDAISLLYQAVMGNVSNSTLYDGASGLGNTSLMLSPAKLILREKQCMPALLSSLLLEIYGIDFELQVLDSLTAKEPSHQVDICICSPSYGVEIQPLWLIGVNYLQFLDILHPIPTSASDSLWIQHCLYHLNDKGKAYLILPIGWLFKGGYDLAVREALVHRNFIESVTILPMAIRQYYQTNLCLVILNKAKTSDNVWLINAENFKLEKKYGGGITQKSINELGKLIANPQQNKFTVSASTTQIAEKKYDLTPSRYFKDPLEIATRELTKELKALADCQQQYEFAKVNLNNLLSLLQEDSLLNQKQL